MGSVRLATDLNLNRTVAIKTPHPDLQSGIGERFDGEIESLTQFRHPNICRILDAGDEDGLPYMVLEHMSGGDLGDRLHARGGRQELDEVLAWLPPIAEALDFTHAQGVVHRDVKPQNILLDEHGRPYLSDFGISKLFGDRDPLRTGTGFFLGSPAYVPPEYVDREFGPEFDQYSLAVVVYQALSGRLPFEAANADRLLIMKATSEPTPIRNYLPNLPEDCARAIMRALMRAPSDRFDSCSGFARALVEAARSPRARFPGLLRGDRLGDRFQIEKSIGEGGTSYLFAAFDEQNRRSVVIGIAPPSLVESPEIAGRFVECAMDLRHERHPHLPNVLCAGANRGLYWYAVDFVDGLDLRQKLRDAGGSQALDEVLHWLPAIAEALEFIHSRGVCHRDVSPETIRIDDRRTGSVYLTDFVIGNVLREAPQLSTDPKNPRRHLFLGREHYAAPEHFRRNEPIGPAADQYSLAVLVFEALAGRLPYENTTWPALLVSKTRVHPPLTRYIRAGRATSRALARALSPDPEDRFDSCVEFADALRVSGKRLTPLRIACLATAAAAMSATVAWLIS